MASTVRDRRHHENDGGGGRLDDNEPSAGKSKPVSSAKPVPSDRGRSRGSGKTRSNARGARVKSAHIITEHIDVGVPAEVAFDQWMQYDKWSEMFKKESADTGRKNRHGAEGGGSRGNVKVQAKIGPSERQFVAEVTEVDPGRRISWRSKGQVQAMGTTSFHRLDDRLTHLMVEIEYRPTGFLETIGNFFRMQRRRVRRDLRLFKHYIEMRGEATGRGPRRASGEGLTSQVDPGKES